MEYAITILSALSDPIRLRSLALLARKGELCVCELTQALQAGQPQISKHMATLRDVGLVKVRRDAQWVLYSLALDLPAWVKDAMAAALTGASATKTHADDLDRLKDIPARPLRIRVG
jgi:ArsR family transcriptional regulator